jgi:hypothetical protein
MAMKGIGETLAALVPEAATFTALRVDRARVNKVELHDDFQVVNEAFEFD